MKLSLGTSLLAVSSLSVFIGNTFAIPNHIVCPAEQSIIVPDQSNCNNYIECRDGVATVKQCTQQNYQFSPTSLQCMNPEYANCNVGQRFQGM